MSTRSGRPLRRPQRFLDTEVSPTPTKRNTQPQEDATDSNIVSLSMGDLKQLLREEVSKQLQGSSHNATVGEPTDLNQHGLVQNQHSSVQQDATGVSNDQHGLVQTEIMGNTIQHGLDLHRMPPMPSQSHLTQHGLSQNVNVLNDPFGRVGPQQALRKAVDDILGTGESFNDSPVVGMASMGLPLTVYVPDSMKTKIIEQQYVDLAKLLSPHDDST